MNSSHRRGLDPLRQIPIRDVAIRLGVQLRSGNSLRCPFPDHDDRRPSFSFFPGTNSCRCFGCGRGGSVIDFVAVRQKWSIREAIRWLRKTYFPLSAKLPGRKLLQFRSTAQSGGSPTANTVAHSDFSPNPEIYMELLNNNPVQGKGSEYLAARGFKSGTVSHFRLGFLSDSKQAARHLCEKFSYAAVYKAGLLRHNTSDSALSLSSPSIIFPYFENSKIVYLQSRLLPGVYGSRWMGLRGVRKAIYNRDVIGQASTIFICEGAPDVLAAFEMKLPAIGIAGGSARLSRDTLIAMKGKLINILLDADEPGHRMSVRLNSELCASGIQSVIKTLPMGKDLNEYLLLSRRKR